MALKIAPAMVAGNAVVVKSAEEAPLAVLRACQVMNQVLPPGVLNILSGDGPGCGAPLVAHKRVGKVTFTGSVETGKMVYKSAAREAHPGDARARRQEPDDRHGRRRSRQGGRRRGDRHALHPPGPELHRGEPHLRAGCRSTTPSSTRLKAKVDAMKMGDPLDEATDIGTIISKQQYDKVDVLYPARRGGAGRDGAALLGDARRMRGSPRAISCSR